MKGLLRKFLSPAVSTEKDNLTTAFWIVVVLILIAVYA